MACYTWRTDVATGKIDYPDYEGVDAVADIVDWLISEREWSPLDSAQERRDIADGARLVIRNQDGDVIFRRYDEREHRQDMIESGEVWP
jgi:hypothetical protein